MCIKVPDREKFIKNSIKEKLSNIARNSPQLYYTDNEIYAPNETDTIVLEFFNNFVNNKGIIYSEDVEESLPSISVVRKIYKKVIFKNSIYRYLFVDEEQLDYFYETFLNKQPEKEKKWI